jgi:3-deoxy-manno-octulosonate cytidylyltransferase (CMP-KDO synthetase)
MIQHVYERVVACPQCTDVYVATDDERIFKCVAGFGGKCVMTDPGHCSGTDRICEAAQGVGLNPEDLVINVQGDQPLFDGAVMPLLVSALEEDPDLPMVTLKWRIRDEADLRNENHVKVVTDTDGYALYFSRSAIPFMRDADSDCAFYKHLGVYGFRMAFLTRFTRLPRGILESVEKLEQLRALEHGYRIKVVETDRHSLEVDVPEDIARVERMLKDSGE